MSNKVIYDSIWTSPSLAKLKPYYQDQWPRWLLMQDDWGCFNADPDVIKGTIYPKRPEMTIKKVLEVRDIFSNSGHLFVWVDSEGREWGYFPKSGHYSGSCSYANNGTRTKHRRKTPEPPPDSLCRYLEQLGTKWNNLGQNESDLDLDLDLDPDLDPDHITSSCSTSENQDVNEERQEGIEVPKFTEDSQPYKLTTLLFSLMLGNNPKAKIPANRQKEMVHLERMIRLDKREPADIERVIRWCQVDDFWRANILSTSKLRKQYDQLWLKMNTTTRASPSKKQSMLEHGEEWKKAVDKTR